MTVTITIPFEFIATVVSGLILVTAGRMQWRRRPVLVA
jgi:hypothetical protein